jgi:hypothetical protein
MLIKSFIPVFIFLFSTNSFATESKMVNSILSRISSLEKCDTTKIWPNYDIKQVDTYYFNDPKVSAVYEYNNKLKTLKELDKQDYPDFVFSSYALENIDEKKIASFSLMYHEGYSQEQVLNRSIGLLFHEVFHFIGQDFKVNIPYVKDSGYPYKADPRIYRRMIAIKLFEAITMAQPEKSLEEASFWYQKYKSEFPQDEKEKNAIDISEGSAEYVEAISTIQSENNCHSPKAVIKEFIQHEWARIHRPSFNPSKRSESYYLGLMSYILDVHFSNSKFNTIAQSIQGKGPIGSLLKTVPPRPNKVNEEIAKSINQDIAQSNTKVENYLEVLRNKKTVFLSIDKKVNTVGSFTVDGFLELSNKAFGVDTIFENFFAKYIFNQNSILVNGIDSFDGAISPCGDYEMLIPSTIKLDQVSGSSIKHKSESLELSLENFEIKDNFICL